MGNCALGYFISRFNSGVNGHLKSLDFKCTNFILEILKLLYSNGVIRGYSFKGIFIRVYFKYYLNKHKTFILKQISKPSRRVYWSLGYLSKSYNKNSVSWIYIISTLKGLKTSTDCLLGGNLGGEVLFKFKV